MCICPCIVVARRLITHQPIFVESANDLTHCHHHLISYSIDILMWWHRTFSIRTFIQHRHHLIFMPFKSDRHQINRLTCNTFKLEFFTIPEPLFGRFDDGLADRFLCAFSLHSALTDAYEN